MIQLSRRSLLASLAALPVAGTLARANTLAEEPVLHVITTRRRAGDGSRTPFLDGSRANALSYHRAHLTPPDRSLVGKIGALVTREFAVRGLETLAETDGASAFAEAMRGEDTAMYVHGFNQTFEAAALDAAQLIAGIKFSGNAAMFTWASKGGLLDYGHDRESALLARDPFLEALTAQLQDPFGARLHLIAHSMGTWLTVETLRMYRDRHGDKGADRMGALVLAAPDIDRDVFVASLNRLGAFRSKMTVITATNDRALDLSRRLAGGDRVGALSADQLQGLGIRVIDATEFASGLIGHDVFVANPDVRAAIRRAIERA